jgi:hypothetical protein
MWMQLGDYIGLDLVDPFFAKTFVHFFQDGRGGNTELGVADVVLGKRRTKNEGFRWFDERSTSGHGSQWTWHSFVFLLSISFGLRAFCRNKRRRKIIIG